MAKNLAKLVLGILCSLSLVSCNYYEEKEEGRQALSGRDPLKPNFLSIRKNILEVRCVSCHQPGGTASDVNLTDFRALMKSPRELVLPKNPDESGLLIALYRNDRKRMPPPEYGEPLLDTELALIRYWIELGAPEKPGDVHLLQE